MKVMKHTREGMHNDMHKSVKQGSQRPPKSTDIFQKFRKKKKKKSQNLFLGFSAWLCLKQFQSKSVVLLHHPGKHEAFTCFLPLSMKGTCLYSVSLVQGISRVVEDLSTMTWTISSAAENATWCQCPVRYVPTL